MYKGGVKTDKENLYGREGKGAWVMEGFKAAAWTGKDKGCVLRKGHGVKSDRNGSYWKD